MVQPTTVKEANHQNPGIKVTVFSYHDVLTFCFFKFLIFSFCVLNDRWESLSNILCPHCL